MTCTIRILRLRIVSPSSVSTDTYKSTAIVYADMIRLAAKAHGPSSVRILKFSILKY